MEVGRYDKVFDDAQHPYTKALLFAVPIANPQLARDREIQLLPGDLPSPLNPPSGCVFRTRCPEATEVCGQQNPIKKGSEQHHIYCSNMTLGTI